MDNAHIYKNTVISPYPGLSRYYWRFIRNFAQITQPLHKLTEHSSTFIWSDAFRATFNNLHQHLCIALLVSPNFTRPLILDTDASDIGIGAVLSQTNRDGREKVIGYANCVLLNPECKYCVTQQELLAVVVFTCNTHPYLLSHHFILQTDHWSLLWLRNLRILKGNCHDGGKESKSLTLKSNTDMDEDKQMQMPFLTSPAINVDETVMMTLSPQYWW